MDATIVENDRKRCLCFFGQCLDKVEEILRLKRSFSVIKSDQSSFRRYCSHNSSTFFLDQHHCRLDILSFATPGSFRELLAVKDTFIDEDNFLFAQN